MVAMLLMFTIFGGAAMARLGYWQVVAAPELSAKAERTIARPKEIKPPRAQVIDRDGVVLAQSATLDQLEAHPNIIPASLREPIVERLADILGMRSSAAHKAYLGKLSSGTKWELLERKISLEQSVDIQFAKDAGLLPGIALSPHEVRVYPRQGGEADASLANQLLGFVDSGGRGTYGIEAVYDDRLTGIEQSVDVASIAGAVPSAVVSELPPMRLTIDAGLQRQLEKELFSTRLSTRAKSVSAVVMDPYTGAILASASVPGYDANRFAAVAQRSPSLFRDRVVSDFYEPGSVMKIFTATAALHEGVVTPQTRIKDQVELVFYDDVIQNSDQKSKGTLTVKDGIALSRNIVTAKIAQRLAPKDHQKAARKLFALWQKVGVVGKTGIDVANETGGLGYDPRQYKWAPIDLANRAFGQGVAVTLMQLATGVSTIVNGGNRVQPHVVADSELSGIEPERVLSLKVARQATDILVHVTGSVPWYAKGSLIPGYLIGGKTGTAQIWDTSRGPSGAWKDNIFNHSFIGFVGGDRPEAVIAVRLEEPKVKILGQGILESKIESYELFRMVALAAIKHLDITKAADRNAGLPIIGTAAARSLTPQRNAVEKRRGRQQRDADTASSDRKATNKARGAGQGGTRKERSQDEGSAQAARGPGVES